MTTTAPVMIAARPAAPAGLRGGNAATLPLSEKGATSHAGKP